MLRTIVVIAISIGLCGCTQSGPKTPPDTLVVALGAKPSTLDPRFATDAGGVRVGSLLFNSLVRVGAKLVAEGDAAERWSVDGAKYTFYLRPGLKFHNGKEVLPEDVLYAFAQFRTKGSPYASMLESIRTLSVRRDERQVVVSLELHKPSLKFLTADLPAIRLISPDGALIGTGPYRFVSEDQNEIRLKSVSAATENLVFKVVRDDLTRTQKLAKGEIDLAQAEIPPDKVAGFEGREFQVFRYPGLTMTYILLNFKDPLLRRREVREALALSLDRSEIITHKLRGLGVEATSILTPNNPYFNSDLKNPNPDVAKAQQLVGALGVEKPVLKLKTSNAAQAVDNARVLAHQLAKSGLKIELESYEWATFYDDVKKGAFQLATMKWVGTVDPDIYRMIFHSSETPPGRNRGSYVNVKLDALLEQGAAATELSARKKIYAQVQKMVHEDLVVLPLWYDMQVTIAAKNITGFVPEPSGDFRPFANVRKVQP